MGGTSGWHRPPGLQELGTSVFGTSKEQRDPGAGGSLGRVPLGSKGPEGQVAGKVVCAAEVREAWAT